MRLPSLLLVSALLVFATASFADADTAGCRRGVNKSIAKTYKTAASGATKCFKTRLKTNTSPADCYTAAGYDSKNKLPKEITKLTGALADAPGSDCEGLTPLYAAVCAEPPVACAAECASCVTGAEIAVCTACLVTDRALAQLAALYGTPPDISADADAQKCQNDLGKNAVKLARKRMSEQHRCMRSVDKGDVGPSISCASLDTKKKVAKASAKAGAKALQRCLEKPGVDQIPDLDTSADCLTSDAAAAVACLKATTTSEIDALFALLSSPPSVRGVVVTNEAGDPLVPLPGVRVEFPAVTLGDRTDKNGLFRISQLPPGVQTIFVDGRAVGPYPRVPMVVNVGIVGETSLGIIPLPAIDVANGVTVPVDGTGTVTAPTIVSNPAIPDAEISLPAGLVMTFDSANQTPLVSISVVPFTPMPFPDNVAPDVVYTYQPEGTVLSAPVAVSFPNTSGFAPFSTVNIYRPDFATNSFVVVGTGTVNAAGTRIDSDGAVVDRLDWHFPAVPAICFTTVEGEIVDSVLSNPIAGADVCVSSVCTVSATGPIPAKGRFSIPLTFCPQPVNVQASKLNTTTNITEFGEIAVVVTVDGITDVGAIELAGPECGNGTLGLGEECDDGNHIPGDGCAPTCRIEACGDQFLDPGEECDAGPPVCSLLCTVCGNSPVGILAAQGEECDLGPSNGTNGNGDPGSGCSENCLISICPNGVVEDGESCDEGAIANGGSLSLCGIDCQFSTLNGDSVLDLVRAAEPCPSVAIPAPNTATQEGTPACIPISQESTFKFGPAGGGTVTMGFLPGETDVKVAALLSDIRDSGDVPVPTATATGWTLRVTFRTTLLGGASPLVDVTVVDTTVTGAFTSSTVGNLAAGVLLSSVDGGGTLASYSRRNVQIVSMEVVDPSGKLFAVPGFVAGGSTVLTINQPSGVSKSIFSLARHYDQCTAPDETVDNAQACSAPTAPSTRRFASTGGGFGTGTYRTNTDDLTVQVAIEGVTTDGTTLLGAVPSFSLQMIARFSTNDPLGGEMTLVDFPVTFNTFGSTKGGGAVSIATTLDDFWTRIFGTTLQGGLQAEIHPDLSSDTLLLQVLDDGGSAFASLGVRTQ